MATFLIDECVRSDVRFLIEKAGHQTKILPDQTPDSEVAEYARLHQCILLTWDRDFLNQSTYPASDYFGIFLFRHHNNLPAILEQFVRTVLSYLETNTATGQAFVVRTKSGEPGVIEIVPPGTPRRPHSKGTKNERGTLADSPVAS